MQLSNETEKRLERAIMNRLRHVMEPAVRETMMEVLHGGRRTQNNVQEPAPDGKCREVWDALDEFESPHTVTLADALALAADKGFNPNNARIEFYRWRAFNGYNKTH